MCGVGLRYIYIYIYGIYGMVCVRRRDNDQMGTRRWYVCIVGHGWVEKKIVRIYSSLDLELECTLEHVWDGNRISPSATAV